MPAREILCYFQKLYQLRSSKKLPNLSYPWSMGRPIPVSIPRYVCATDVEISLELQVSVVACVSLTLLAAEQQRSGLTSVVPLSL